MEMNLIVLIYCNGKIMHLSDGSLPMKSITELDNIKEQAVNLIKEIFGLRFKEEQIIVLYPNEEEDGVINIYAMINLSYYPESYTSEEPVFIKLEDEKDLIQHKISNKINSFKDMFNNFTDLNV